MFKIYSILFTLIFIYFNSFNLEQALKLSLKFIFLNTFNPINFTRYKFRIYFTVLLNSKTLFKVSSSSILL